jgi:hypothetical protein
MKRKSIDIRCDGSNLVELPEKMEDECLITKILFYRESLILKILFALLMVLTAGIAYLFARWFLSIKLKLLYLRTKLRTADVLLITSKGLSH